MAARTAAFRFAQSDANASVRPGNFKKSATLIIQCGWTKQAAGFLKLDVSLPGCNASLSSHEAICAS
jgi:hypothetical protein